MTLPTGTPIGKYVVRRKLAEGGMGEVYLCSAHGPEDFEKEVVIKRVRPFIAKDEEFVRMFISEARLASRFNHANIVQIFDFDRHEDTYYLAMEYVRGHSLRDVQNRAKQLMVPMPPTMVAHIGAEVARGLHYAHCLTDKGKPLELVHRDVTPHNVLLSFDGAVKLTDFGIAKASTRQSLTAPGMLKGKFPYMSPEQARGDDVDARTDIFALGILMWEMLTGGRLFVGDSDIAVLRAVERSVIAPPARLNPDVPDDLDAAVMKALERNIQARCQTAEELEWALRRFIGKHATSRSDTDVGAFVRRLFADEDAIGEAEEAEAKKTKEEPQEEPQQESRGQKTNGSISATTPSPARTAATIFENTPLKGVVADAQRPAPQPLPLSPDEDPAASTVPVRRSATPEAPAPQINVSSDVKPRRRSAIIALGLMLVVGGAAAAASVVFKTRSVPTVPAATVDAAIEPPPRPSKEEDLAVTEAQEAPEPSPKKLDDINNKNSNIKIEQPDRPTNNNQREPGYLVVKVNPWATVFIDAKSQGVVAGVRKFRLPAGKHSVRFEYAGTLKESSVRVESGKSVEQSFRPDPLK